MDYKYRARWKKKLHHEEEVVSLDAAIARCNRAVIDGATIATVLRADTTGINAGKYFLHLIVK